MALCRPLFFPSTSPLASSLRKILDVLSLNPVERPQQERLAESPLPITEAARQKKKLFPFFIEAPTFMYGETSPSSWYKATFQASDRAFSDVGIAHFPTKNFAHQLGS